MQCLFSKWPVRKNTTESNKLKVRPCNNISYNTLYVHLRMKAICIPAIVDQTWCASPTVQPSSKSDSSLQLPPSPPTQTSTSVLVSDWAAYHWVRVGCPYIISKLTHSQKNGKRTVILTASFGRFCDNSISDPIWCLLKLKLLQKHAAD